MGTWKLTIDFDAGLPHGFHVGSGYGFAGRIDQALLRDAQGLPFIPGSALKGKLRHAAYEIAPSLGHKVEERDCLPKPGERPCVICRVFGSPFRAGKLFVSDATANLVENPLLGLATMEKAAPRIWEERTGVAIDRRTRTASARLLFRIETAPAGLTLQATLTGDLDESTETPLLKAAVKTLRWLGADSSRGLGGCQCHLL